MQLVLCMCILLLSITAYYALGRAFCIKLGCSRKIPETVCIGFFLYFAAFQVVAEILILTKQKLHMLTAIWVPMLLAVLAVSGMVIWRNQGRQPAQAVKSMRPQRDTAARLLYALMAAAVLCECASAVLMQRFIGWDFAYYIGNMVTSVATDTMYVYDGSGGLMRSTLDLRYALSSFYMNTAWISQLTGISALVLQKYVMGILCVLLTNAVAYSFAMEVFNGDKKKSAVLVTVTALLVICWNVYDTSAQFLMYRNYEAKAYCANVVLPMVLFLLYRIWRDSSGTANWAELFATALASVPVSMSSIVLVPALITVMLGAHMAVERQWDAAFIRRSIYCLLPNICYLLVYFSYTRGWLMVEV